MAPPIKRKKTVFYAAAPLLAALAVFLIFSGFYHCPVDLIFGIPCPGCGMTRAFLCLLKGDLSGSLQMHPLLLPVLIFFAYYACALLFGWKKPGRRFYYAAAGALFAVWAARMILFFGRAEPMLFNERSLTGLILGYMRKK